MSKYTAEQVERTASQWTGLKHDMLMAFAALLRERESAKAAVADELAERVLNRYVNECILHLDEAPVHLRVTAMRAALEAVAPMLASAWVPDEKEDLDPVRLRREGRVATEWERGFNEGWNDCRDAMLAAAGEPNHDA